MNPDRFHNQLALRLGYERIVKDKRIDIRIDDKLNPDDPWVVLEMHVPPMSIGFNASDEPNKVWKDRVTQEQKGIIDGQNIENEISKILEASHFAYIDANSDKFECMHVIKMK